MRPAPQVARGPGACEVERAVEKRVIVVVAAIVGSRAVEAETSWRSLGMDSLDLLSLVTALEDEFDVRIPDLVAIALRNVSDVTALLLSSAQ